MELGRSFYVKMVAAIVGLALACLLGFLVFNRLIYRYGFIGGTAIVVGILLLIAHFYDRKHVRAYEDEAES
jgi:Mn2+/Fe2+ NRAMP family transporter